MAAPGRRSEAYERLVKGHWTHFPFIWMVIKDQKNRPITDTHVFVIKCKRNETHLARFSHNISHTRDGINLCTRDVLHCFEWIVVVTKLFPRTPYNEILDQSSSEVAINFLTTSFQSIHRQTVLSFALSDLQTYIIIIFSFPVSANLHTKRRWDYPRTGHSLLPSCSLWW